MNDLPLNVIKICYVCEENNSTDKCPTFQGLKVVYQREKWIMK